MGRPVRAALRKGFLRLEDAVTAVVGEAWNPLRQLGAVAFLLFWVAAVSGIYLYVFFDTSIAGAYRSVEALTRDQWYAGGVMRGLHRYASDAFVVAMFVHLGREFALDRYRGVRWFTWLTGVPLIGLAFAAGIGGYWLVWDRLAQFIAVVTSEWLDWLPLFAEPIANNFLTSGSLSDRFFSLLVFLHIAVPLFLLLGIWVHLLRISRPKVVPARGLMLGTLAALLVLAFVLPARSQGEADLGSAVTVVGLDWFYLAAYPLLDRVDAGWAWLGLAVGTAALGILPWLPRPARVAAAVVDLRNCNGCGLCFADCPFGAVVMQPRTDDRPFPRNAVVSPDLCTGCGICVGACPTSTPFRSVLDLVTGIDLPDRPLDRLRADLEAAVTDRAAGPFVVVFGCDYGVDVARLGWPGVVAFSLPCIGALPPSFIDYAIMRLDVAGVVLTGCADCFHRFGVAWTEQRLAGTRDPYLRERVPRDRLATAWCAPHDRDAVVAAIASLRQPRPMATVAEHG